MKEEINEKQEEKLAFIKPLEMTKMEVTIGGEALLMNKMSGEAEEALKNYTKGIKKNPKKTGAAIIKEEEKDLMSLVMDKIHFMPKTDIPAFPVNAIKYGIINSMTRAKELHDLPTQSTIISKEKNKSIFVKGVNHIEYAEITFKKSDVLENFTELNGRGAPRYTIRPLFLDWKMTFQVEFPTRLFDADEMINYINYAGYFCGLGSFAARNTGSYGKYNVITKKVIYKSKQI